jgi:hypothetical protein
MSDVEIHAPDRDTMIAAAKLIGAWDEESEDFRQGGITESGIVFALNCYGTKVVDEQTQPGFYAIGRWMSDEPFPEHPGITVIPLPDDSPIKWA